MQESVHASANCIEQDCDQLVAVAAMQVAGLLVQEMLACPSFPKLAESDLIPPIMAPCQAL